MRASDKNYYQNLWDTCIVKTDVTSTVNLINKNKARYQAVTNVTKVPWYVIAVIHSLEADLDFNCHLANGDSLSAKTIHVPSGLPRKGKPPFSWEDAAIAAIQYDKLDKITEWDIPTVLEQLEDYNGWGYISHGINSPYLWSKTNHYTCGKYIADGVWDSKAVSSQIGAACLLKSLLLPEKEKVKPNIAVIETTKFSSIKNITTLIKENTDMAFIRVSHCCCCVLCGKSTLGNNMFCDNCHNSNNIIIYLS